MLRSRHPVDAGIVRLWAGRAFPRVCPWATPNCLDTALPHASLTQTCPIAFAGGFVNQLVYKLHYSPDGSSMGRTNFFLAYMDVNPIGISEEDKRLLNGSRFRTMKMPQLSRAVGQRKSLHPDLTGLAPACRGNHLHTKKLQYIALHYIAH
eukprot:TsM_000341500 transcript=TsM_000341500 gene=TsM_000341500